MRPDTIHDDDAALIDRGWEDMAARLDRAMPVRRRRPGWWWLVAAVLVAGLGGWWLGVKNAVSPPVPVVPMGGEAVSAPAQAAALPVQADGPVSPVGPATPVGLDAVLQAASSPAQAAALPVQGDGSVSPAGPATPVVLDAVLPAEGRGAKSAAAPAAVQTTPAAIQAAPARGDAPLHSSAGRLSLLSGGQPAALQRPSGWPLPARHFTHPAGDRAAAPGGWLAVSSLLRPSLQGFSLGGGLQWQLRPRLSLVTGLQYAFLRQGPGGGNGQGLRAEASVDLSTTNQLLDTTMLNWAQPLRSHWLELPVGLAWRLGPRGSLSAGLQLGRALALRLPQGWEVNNYLLEPSGTFGSSSTNTTQEWFGNSVTTTAVAASQVRAWQLSGWLRYDYRLSRGLALSAGLRYGNGHWVDVQAAPLGATFLSLGVRYQW